MEKHWLWIAGGAALLLVLYMSSRNSGAPMVVPGTDTSAETAARFSFAASGLDSLSRLAGDVVGYQTAQATALGVAQSQVAIEQQRDAAVIAAANAQADAQKYTAHQAERASSNSSVWGAVGAVATALAFIL